MLFYDYYRPSFEQLARSSYLRFIRHVKQNRHAASYLTANNYLELRKMVFYEDGDADVLVPKLFFDQMTQEAYMEGWKIPGAVESMLRHYITRAPDPTEIFKLTPEQPPPHKLANKDSVIDTPTMVLWGLKDKILPYEYNRDLKRFVKHLKVVEYPNYSHWIIHENPSEITKRIEMFLQTLSQRSSDRVNFFNEKK